MTLQIAQDWWLKFNAHRSEGLIDRNPPGQSARFFDQDWQHLFQNERQAQSCLTSFGSDGNFTFPADYCQDSIAAGNNSLYRNLTS